MKIVTISDNPLSGTGVAHQMLLIINGILKQLPEAEILSLALQAGQAQQVNEHWRIESLTRSQQEKPENRVLELARSEKIDCLLLMTDPRFYLWMSSVEHELKNLVPNILYYHVWDNDPPPKFNRPFYECFDEVACISKLTYNVCKSIGVPAEKLHYVPHAIEPNIFLPRGGREKNPVFTVLWDSVNIKRKAPQNAIIAFSMLHKKHPDTQLVMKTQPMSSYGGNLFAIAADWNVPPDSITFIERRDLSYEQLANLYSQCHVLLNTSFNEGFGLSILQGLYTGCVCICPATGGMQDQVPPAAKFGYSIPIDYRFLDNGVECPYIYFDYTKPESIAERLERAYAVWKQNPKAFTEKGVAAREWALKNFNLDDLQNYFVKAVQKKFRTLEAPIYEIASV